MGEEPLVIDIDGGGSSTDRLMDMQTCEEMDYSRETSVSCRIRIGVFTALIPVASQLTPHGSVSYGGRRFKGLGNLRSDNLTAIHRTVHLSSMEGFDRYQRGYLGDRNP